MSDEGFWHDWSYWTVGCIVGAVLTHTVPHPIISFMVGFVTMGGLRIFWGTR